MAPIIITGMVYLIAGLVFIFSQPRPTLPTARGSFRKHKVNLLEDIGAGAVWKDRGGDL